MNPDARYVPWFLDGGDKIRELKEQFLGSYKDQMNPNLMSGEVLP
jgi:hypothetical protein